MLLWRDKQDKKSATITLTVSRGFVLINQVSGEEVPPTEQPLITQVSHHEAWDIFRFGPSFGVPFEDGLFPMSALDTFWKQMIPDLNRTLEEESPTWNNLEELATQLTGAVLMGHSQSGVFPLEAAIMNPDGIKGLVLVETGRCRLYGLTEEQLNLFAKMPIPIVFGDHLAETYNGFWQFAFDSCLAFTERVNEAGADAEMLHPAELGTFGKSHMLMQGTNSLEITDVVIDWIAAQVR